MEVRGSSINWLGENVEPWSDIGQGLQCIAIVKRAGHENRGARKLCVYEHVHMSTHVCI